ncbi:transposase, MuDR, MULE transposase domain protein [Tanacetum coccineum]
MRPLIIIDAAHLKGTYLGTNLVAVGMDGNNQVIPITTGVSQGETDESWTWFLRKLKECIGEDFEKLMTDIHAVRPDAHQKLVEAGVEKWSWAKCIANRYNYKTSNSVESINALTKTVRKIPITSLMDWFRQLLQDWYYERRKNMKVENTPDDELTPWASAKIKYRYLKSSNWSVRGIIKNEMYQVRDNQGIHTVYLEKGECTCRIWKLLGLPFGHVCAVARVEGLTYVNNLAKPWFLNKTIKGTYA